MGSSEEKHLPALTLAIDHFIDELFDPFKKQTQEVLLYKGSPKTIEECPSFLMQLAMPLLEETVVSISLDFSHVNSRLEEARILSYEGFSELLIHSVGGQLPFDPRSELGVVISLHDSISQKLNELSERGQPFRVVRPEAIISSWHGLDTLFISSELEDTDTSRQLMGFSAAGGKVLKV